MCFFLLIIHMNCVRWMTAPKYVWGPLEQLPLGKTASKTAVKWSSKCGLANAQHCAAPQPPHNHRHVPFLSHPLAVTVAPVPTTRAAALKGKHCQLNLRPYRPHRLAACIATPVHRHHAHQLLQGVVMQVRHALDHLACHRPSFQRAKPLNRLTHPQTPRRWTLKIRNSGQIDVSRQSS